MKLVIEIDEEVLGRSGTSDQKSYEFRPVEEYIGRSVCDLLEELVSRDLDQSLETDG